MLKRVCGAVLLSAAVVSCGGEDSGPRTFGRTFENSGNDSSQVAKTPAGWHSCEASAVCESSNLETTEVMMYAYGSNTEQGDHPWALLLARTATDPADCALRMVEFYPDAENIRPTAPADDVVDFRDETREPAAVAFTVPGDRLPEREITCVRFGESHFALQVMAVDAAALRSSDGAAAAVLNSFDIYD